MAAPADIYPELTAEENRDLSALDKLLLSNQRKREKARQDADEHRGIARKVIEPEKVAAEAKEREAKKAELRELLAELEAEKAEESESGG